MIYEWKCDSCGRVTEVMRPMSDSAVPPEACKPYYGGYEGRLARAADRRPPCGTGVTFTKKLSLTQRLAVDSGREGNIWPLRHPHLPGNPVFQNRQELTTYLEATGQCLAADGYDSSNHGSQHSVYDKSEVKPPSHLSTEEADRLLAQATYVDEEQVQVDLDSPVEVSSTEVSP